MEPWIDIKQKPPTRCGNICVKLSDGTITLTHVVVATVGKHLISEGFFHRLRHSGEFTLLAESDIVICYAYYTHDISDSDTVSVNAKDIVSYYYY